MKTKTQSNHRAKSSQESGSSDRMMVELSEVNVYFGRQQALKEVGLKISGGDRLALLGPNGAGKSTLIKVICGALDPNTGRVWLNNLKPETALLDPKLLGWLPEGAPLNPELTVLEHLILTYKLRGLAKSQGEAEIDRLTEALNLSKKLDRLAGGLSMGSRRQAALALALLAGPKLLVLDEPTSSLDPDEIKRFTKIINNLPHSTTLIISSHILTEVATLTKTAVFLNQGKIVGQGGWDSLPGGLADPAKSYFEVIKDGQAA
ncbi:MAG: ABC transporter ATP-binding protein [Deltaproteobacteria bacterium]|jgi:ABC-2 type transport system ATP-binding protein|nr:ABC transporter ATP-binding protein [Deltaproteobacteria bacterium]